MGLFRNDDGSDEPVCPSHDLSEVANDPVVGHMTFHNLNKIISGSAALFVFFVVFVFKMMHATHFSNPKQQGNIMRIALLMPMFVIISWFSLAFPEVYPYLDPWIHVIEGWSLCSFFLLLCEFIAPSQEERDVFLATKSIPRKKKNAVDGAKWFKARWIMVFQYPIIAFLVAIFSDITNGAGVYCMFSSDIHFAKFWLNIIGFISLGIALITMLKIFKALKPELAVHKAMTKFVAFKAVIFLTFVQEIVIMILEDHTDIMEPSSTMTWTDLHVGIPCMLICLEMVPLSLFFVWAYPWSPYAKSNNPVVQYQGGFLGYRAFFEMMNPSELLHGIVFAFKPGSGRER